MTARGGQQRYFGYRLPWARKHLKRSRIDTETASNLFERQEEQKKRAGQRTVRPLFYLFGITCF